MHITPTERTVIEFTLTVTEAEARAALDDPFSFGERLAEALRPHLPGAAPVRRKPKPSSQLTLSKNGRGQRKAARRPAGTAAPKGGPSLARIECRRCGKPIAAKFMRLHLQKAHGAASAETPSKPVPDTAPAAE